MKFHLAAFRRFWLWEWSLLQLKKKWLESNTNHCKHCGIPWLFMYNTVPRTAFASPSHQTQFRPDLISMAIPPFAPESSTDSTPWWCCKGSSGGSSCVIVWRFQLKNCHIRSKEVSEANLNDSFSLSFEWLTEDLFWFETLSKLVFFLLEFPWWRVPWPWNHDELYELWVSMNGIDTSLDWHFIADFWNKCLSFHADRLAMLGVSPVCNSDWQSSSSSGSRRPW